MGVVIELQELRRQRQLRRATDTIRRSAEIFALNEYYYGILADHAPLSEKAEWRRKATLMRDLAAAAGQWT